jgi:3-oxoacyl-[acyl-carrier protein] reductase
LAGRRLERAQETAGLIAAQGGTGWALAADVAKTADVTRMMGECVTRFGPVDILVNNAGVRAPSGILAVSEAQLDYLLAVNVKGVYLCCRAAAPLMIEKRWGRIINIASVAGIRASINAAYCASKAAAVALTKSMALELSPRGITVNAICPGTIVSEMTEAQLSDAKERAYLLSRSLVGRIGEPADVAAGAVYLASEEAGFVTGAILAIDGGWTIS